MLKFGVALLLLSLESCLWAVKTDRTYEPTKAPLILKKDRPTQLSFVAEGDFTYNIELSFVHANDCGDLNPAFNRLADADVLNVQVEDGGKVVDTQRSFGIRDTCASYMVPASFHGQAGHRYNVTIIPQQSFSDLQVMQPMAKISVDYALLSSESIRPDVPGALAISLFLLGIGLTLAGRRPKR